MPVLVTGATGIAGQRVVRSTARRGWSVRALTRDPAAARLPAGVEVVAGDFTGPSSLAAAVKALVEEGTPVGPTSRPVRHRCFGGTRCG